MKMIRSFIDDIRELVCLARQWRGREHVVPRQDETLEWLRDQQRLSQQRTGNWQADRYRVVVDPREDRGHD